MSTGDHSIRKYDEELEAIRSRVLQMGGLVESQVRTALNAFEMADQATCAAGDRCRQASQRARNGRRPDGQLCDCKAPAHRRRSADDHRRCQGDYRSGAHRRRSEQDCRASNGCTKKAIKHGSIAFRTSSTRPKQRLRCCGERSTRSRAWMRSRQPSIIKDDLGIDDRFPRSVAAVDHVHDGRSTHHLGIAGLVWVAKAIERIGDHAKNVAEHVIFISQGWDARHRSLEDIERAVAGA